MNPWIALFAIPTYLQSLVVFLISFPFWQRPVDIRGGLVLVTWRPWFAKRWKYSTTLGVIMGTHDIHAVSDRLLAHEQVHALRQYPDMNVLGLALSGVAMLCGVQWWLALAMFWGSSGMLWLVPNYLTGWIRFGDAYMGSEHERSAYAQTQ